MIVADIRSRPLRLEDLSRRRRRHSGYGDMNPAAEFMPVRRYPVVTYREAKLFSPVSEVLICSIDLLDNGQDKTVANCSSSALIDFPCRRDVSPNLR